MAFLVHHSTLKNSVRELRTSDQNTYLTPCRVSYFELSYVLLGHNDSVERGLTVFLFCN